MWGMVTGECPRKWRISFQVLVPGLRKSHWDLNWPSRPMCSATVQLWSTAWKATTTADSEHCLSSRAAPKIGSLCAAWAWCHQPTGAAFMACSFEAWCCWSSSKATMHKEFTPQGQGQGRDFYRDFAQPSQAVWDYTAAPDATKGLPQPGPAATVGPVQPGAKFCQQGAKSASGEEHAFQF